MSLGRAFGSLAGLTLLSRLSGFVRVAVFAAMYGGGREADLFLAAMILPELLYKFMADGLVSAAAIPLFVRDRLEPIAVRRAFWSLFWPVSAGALLLTLGLAAFAEPVCGLLTPGFDTGLAGRMVVLWRILAPYTLLSIQAALLTSFLNAMGSFGRPAIGPLLVNLVIIAGMVAAGDGPVETIGYAVLAGAAAQLLWLFHLARHAGAAYVAADCAPSKIDWNIPLRFAAGAGPVAGWVLLTAVVPVFERALLSSAPGGTVAALNYTDKLMNLPLGIVSISLASAVFPALSSAGDEDRLRLIRRAFWALGALLVPVVLVMTGAAESVTSVVYRRGRFDVGAAALTARLLEAYGWALLPVSAVMLLNRLCFAAGRYRLPFLIGLAGVTLQVGLDIRLTARIGAAGVGWGAVGAAVFQLVCLAAALVHSSAHRSGFTAALLPLVFWGGISIVGSGGVTILGATIRAALPSGMFGELAALGALWGLLQLLAIPVALIVHRQGSGIRE
ncbi:MAG TPA: lipid II flippase MurJ [Candidatus Ozemobacteraceae bacterium]|nr:lipid II flippase MurJ [Candidatus Ozemobacteraceae bacterium]